MTTGGWVFMLASVGFAWSLMLWCFWKVLGAPKDVTKPPDSLGG